MHNPYSAGFNTYLSLLLVEIVNDDTDEEIEREEGAEDDEDDEVQIHVQAVLFNGLLFHLFRYITDAQMSKP